MGHSNSAHALHIEEGLTKALALKFSANILACIGKGGPKFAIWSMRNFLLANDRCLPVQDIEASGQISVWLRPDKNH